jgi:hypothetical protein
MSEVSYGYLKEAEKRIAELTVQNANMQENLNDLEAELAELREAAQEVVGWDWAGLKYEPYHVDWFEALVDVGLLEKLLQESSDE